MKHVLPFLLLIIFLVLMRMMNFDVINRYAGITAMFISLAVCIILGVAFDKRKKHKGTSSDSGSNMSTSNSSWSSDYSDSGGGDCGGGDCGCD